MSKRFGIGMLVMAVLFGTVGAQDEQKDKKRDPDVIFKKLDTDNDKHLSKPEFLKLADYGKDKEKAREFLGRVFEKIVDARAKGMTGEQFKKFLIDSRKKKSAPSS